MPSEASTPKGHMARAIELARGAEGRVSPNPPVGAVLVRDGVTVGEGATQPPGGPHAEAVALAQAGAGAKGAELYVTLEPCAHHGRTPPCTDALIAAGIERVHVAALDPAPHTDGRGVAALEGAGITVTVEGSAAATELVEAFAKHVRTGLPFVTAKFAMSLDGKLATRTGDARWISGEGSRRRAHELRARADAVMVGIGTALADDPRLTARDVEHPPETQPLRVVVDSAGRLPADAAMLGEQGATLVAMASAGRADALAEAGAEVVVLPGAGGRVDLGGLLAALGARGIVSVLVEGGAELLGALFDGRHVDKVVAFVAPVVIGGADAPSAVGGRGPERIADALRLRGVRYEPVDGDLMVVGYPAG